MKMFKKLPASSPNPDAPTFTWDFTNKLGSSETISSVVGITANPSGDLTIGGGSISGALVQARISAGVTGKIYVVTCSVSTNLANTLSIQIGISVNDPKGE